MQDVERRRAADVRLMVAGKIDAIGWGLFFIWLGVAFLADVGWSGGVLGVGVIALGGQAARKYFGLPLEHFSLLMGILMTAWGAWHLLGLQFGVPSIPGGFIPLLFIAVGVMLVIMALRRNPPR